MSATKDSLKIVIVDDDVGTLEVEALAVEELGYQAVATSDPVEVVELVENDPAVGLVIVDLVMPGSINGITLANRLRQINPGVKVVYTSGYVPVSTMEKIRDSGELILPKPWRIAALAQLIETALAS